MWTARCSPHCPTRCTGGPERRADSEGEAAPRPGLRQRQSAQSVHAFSPHGPAAKTFVSLEDPKISFVNQHWKKLSENNKLCPLISKNTMNFKIKILPKLADISLSEKHRIKSLCYRHSFHFKGPASGKCFSTAGFPSSQVNHATRVPGETELKKGNSSSAPAKKPPKIEHGLISCV